MFGWLTNMLLKTPVQGSGCGCCEAKRASLEKMRREIANGELDESKSLSQNFSSGSLRVQCSGDGQCRSQEYVAKVLGPMVMGDYPPEVFDEDSRGCDGKSCSHK